jgi:hypothetical protein
MHDDKQTDEKQPDLPREEYRSLSTDMAALAMPVAVVTAPVVNAWAKQRFPQDDKAKDSASPPSEQSKDDGSPG